MLDHFQTVARAIARKVRSGANPSTSRDTTGGSTFTFALTPDHPMRGEVEALFAEMRTRAQAIWDRVAAHNGAHPPSANERFRVSLYLGQTREEDENEDGKA